MKKSIIAFTLILSGCATDPVYNHYVYNWIPPKNSPEIVMIYHDKDDVHRVCELNGARLPKQNDIILACAISRPGVCIVHLPRNPPEMYVTHELLHCAGWHHEIINK
jgi:hypothetical protein